ncbi:MAG: hypothetical protein V1907_00130 [Candidatus Kerfeldbacteria bacterium]
MVIQQKILDFTHKHIHAIGICAILSVIANITLIGGHPILAVVVIIPLLLFGIVFLIASVPGVKHLESLGRENVQDFVVETGSDVSALTPHERNKAARRWKRSRVSQRALQIYGALIVLIGCIALVMTRQWAGALIVGSLLCIIIIQGLFRRKKK